MKFNGWEGVVVWKNKVNVIVLIIVGGLKKYGGVDFGFIRVKKVWFELGVNGKSLVDEFFGFGFEGIFKLIVWMVVIIQGFLEEWVFIGKKMAFYWQVGNVFLFFVVKDIGGVIVFVLWKE